MNSPTGIRSPASLQAEASGEGTLVLSIRGQLDSTSTGSIWREAMKALDHSPAGRVVVDASGLTYCDGTGAAFLLELRAPPNEGRRNVGDP